MMTTDEVLKGKEGTRQLRARLRKKFPAPHWWFREEVRIDTRRADAVAVSLHESRNHEVNRDRAA